MSGLICTCGRDPLDQHHADSCPVAKRRAQELEKSRERAEGERREDRNKREAIAIQNALDIRDAQIRMIAAHASPSFAMFAVDEIQAAGGDPRKVASIMETATSACVDFAERLVGKLELRAKERRH